MRERPARAKQARPAAGREGETVEHKSQWTDRALEDLAAFANHKGGTLLVGIADDGKVIGFPHTDKDLQAIANQIADTLGVRPRVRAERRGPKTILSITVKPSLMPVSCRGRYLIRVGSVNREMTPDQIARRFVEKLGQTWDALPSDLKPDAVDPEALRHFARLAATRLPQVRESDPPLRTLENLELLRDGMLTNGGALLFARRPQQVCSSATLHVGRFKAGVVEDDRMATSTLWTQLDTALAAFRTYLQVRFEVAPKTATVEGLQRKEIWEYPLDALREAVINALIHRDYTALGEIQVRVREDSIEVWNPGGLPEGVKLEDLRREGHTSRPRNPVLAQVFFYAGLVERWGSGTTNMIRACRVQGLPEPEFSEHTGGFAVTFSKDPLHGGAPADGRLQRAAGARCAASEANRADHEHAVSGAHRCQQTAGIGRSPRSRNARYFDPEGHHRPRHLVRAQGAVKGHKGHPRGTGRAQRAGLQF